MDASDLKTDEALHKAEQKLTMQATTAKQSSVQSTKMPRQDKFHGTPPDIRYALAQMSILHSIDHQNTLEITMELIGKFFNNQTSTKHIVNNIWQKFTSQSSIGRPFEQPTFQSALNSNNKITLFITTIVKKMLRIIMKKQSAIYTLVFGSRGCGKTICGFIIQILTENIIKCKLAGLNETSPPKLPKQLKLYWLMPKIIIISVCWTEMFIKRNVGRQCLQSSINYYQNEELLSFFERVQKAYHQKGIKIVIILDQLNQYYQKIGSFARQTTKEYKPYLLKTIRKMQEVIDSIKKVFAYSIIGILQEETDLDIIYQVKDNINFQGLIPNSISHFSQQSMRFYEIGSFKDRQIELNRIALYQLNKALQKCLKYKQLRCKEFIIKEVYEGWSKILKQNCSSWSFSSCYSHIVKAAGGLAAQINHIDEQSVQNPNEFRKIEQKEVYQSIINNLISILQKSLQILTKSGQYYLMAQMKQFSNKLDPQSQKNHIRLIKYCRNIAEKQIKQNQQAQNTVGCFDIPITHICSQYKNLQQKNISQETSDQKSIILMMKNKLLYKKYFVFYQTVLRIYIPPKDFIIFTNYISDLGKQLWEKKLENMKGNQLGKQYQRVSIQILALQKDITAELDQTINICNSKLVNFLHFHYRMESTITEHLKDALSTLEYMNFNTYIGCRPQSRQPGERSDTSASFDILLICRQSLLRYKVKSIDFTINAKTNDLFVDNPKTIKNTKFGKASQILQKMQEQLGSQAQNQISFDWTHLIICPPEACESVQNSKSKSQIQGLRDNINFIAIPDVKIENLIDYENKQAYNYFLQLFSRKKHTKLSSNKKKFRKNESSYSDVDKQRSDRDTIANSTKRLKQDRGSTPDLSDRQRSRDKPKIEQPQGARKSSDH